MALINVPNINNLDAATPELFNSRFGTIANELNGNLDAANLKDAAVTAPKLATDSVTTGKIPDAAVTPPKWSNPYKFSAYRNAALSLPTSVAPVVLDTEVFDTNGNFDTATGKYTAPVNGFYWFYGQLTFATVTSGQYFWASIMKNGAVTHRGNRGVGSGGTEQPSIAALLQLSAGDTVELSYASQSNQSAEVGADKVYMFGWLVTQT